VFWLDNCGRRVYRPPAAKRFDWSLPTEILNVHQNEIHNSGSKKRAEKSEDKTRKQQMAAKFGVAIQKRGGDIDGAGRAEITCRTGAQSFTHCAKNSKFPSASVINAVGV
jgi:hypothetical protein